MIRGAPVLALALACGSAPIARAAEPIGQAGPGYAGARDTGALVLRGDDRLIGGEAPAREPIAGGPVSLNLVEVPLPVAAKAVFADTLGWGYSLDERASGTITLQTGGAVSREALLHMFETALASRGLSLRRSGRSVQIVPSGGAPDLRPVQGVGAEAGAVAVPLRWISAAEMQAILGAVAPREVVLRADRARNLLILSGDANQIRVLRQTIAVFDVDWMRGMSTAMVPVRSSNPVALARDLTQIFGGETSGSGDVIRFVPNEALNAILVVSSRAAYLDRARALLAQLETLAADRERQLFVYRIQNRSAKELAAVLQGVVMAEMGGAYGMSGMGGYGGGYASASGSYAAMGGGYGGSLGGGLGGVGAGGGLGGAGGFGGGSGSGGFSGSSTTAGAAGGGALGAAGGSAAGGASPSGSGWASGGDAGAGGAGFGASGGLGTATAGGGGMLGGGAYGGGYGGGLDSGFSGGGAGMRRDAIGIVADDANNSLVISATRNQYDKILRILGRLDAMPTQVLLETVIAEVTLNDSLAFGVQWFLKERGSRFNLASTDTDKAATTNGTVGLITSAIRGVPGFNYLLAGTDFNVVLNALQGVTRVNVISSPNITVLDNRTAKLQVGDQVPIIKQTGQSALTAGAPILNQIEMKDTGVILSVTPRVNKNGLVVLDINQEVSDVVPTTTSTIDSPTIRQRRVATSVAVNDGHSLAIGGMVQEKAQITNENLPVLSDLPVIGAAFRNRVDQRVRTELLVFIRPRVIRGTAEADRISEDFRQQFRAMMPVRPVLPPPPLPAAHQGSQGILRRMLD
ncbi:general secretion pathway protein D [Methylobacterium sp. 174MFSha1.1]|uniref:type II secretion system secretin GspD n=1 Tax=Methylobacterium sp. 174MFSha1.1 TaxID=1502749 RepID=UPI0008DFA6BB|nr:type II secretion system secretin GspD [Methylobacterium sp. 174MFSha1.1]SFU88773.1 general secretion pathway protein D [Methylobacterium sp. 174MFSha1.1]